MNLIQYMRNSEANGGHSGLTFDSEPLRTVKEADGSYSVQQVRGRLGLTHSQYVESKRWIEQKFAEAVKGNSWARLQLREALTTSDFSTLFGDVLDRSVLANYAETPYSWASYIKRATISDFRLAKIFRVDRGASVLDGPLNPNVTTGQRGSGPNGLEQLSEYPMRYRTASQYTDQLYKFGARMDFAWETLINDDLDALKDTPALFGRAARRTEEERATKLYTSSTGPNATFFSNANKNLLNTTTLTNLTTYYGVNNNPKLSINALQAAMVLMMLQVDQDGEPISIEGATLVVPPGLKITAMNILNASQVWANDQGGTVSDLGPNTATTSLQRLITDNWAKSIVKLAVNYYAPVVNTTTGNSAWYLFSDPNNGRPAAQLSFLRGHESPELFMKLPNSVAIGEGQMGPGAGLVPGTMNVNPMEGDFENDVIAYKIRHIIGGTLLDPIMAVASTGADS